MRDCALWISPWVNHDTEVIIDTSAMTEHDWRAVVHNDPDAPPKDSVLVVIHPARYVALKEARPFPAVYNMAMMADPNGRIMAAAIIDRHCARDAELGRSSRC